MPEILLVDDERVVRSAYKALLEKEGYAVRVAAGGRAGVEAFVRKRPDLVLLDVMMPQMDGYESAAEMRRHDRDTPIVFLSALDAEEDQVKGLEVGGDDYVSKAATPVLLLVRLRKALERARRLSVLDAPTGLSKIQADIYRLLASDRGRYFTYYEIFAAICGEGYYHDSGALRTHICRLRTCLPAGMKIETKRGRGYALV